MVELAKHIDAIPVSSTTPQQPLIDTAQPSVITPGSLLEQSENVIIVLTKVPLARIKEKSKSKRREQKGESSKKEHRGESSKSRDKSERSSASTTPSDPNQEKKRSSKRRKPKPLVDISKL